MMTIKRISNDPYKVTYGTVDASKVANGEKPFPAEWINDKKNNVTDEAIGYFLPLINGEVSLITKNGIPCHFEIK